MLINPYNTTCFNQYLIVVSTDNMIQFMYDTRMNHGYYGILRVSTFRQDRLNRRLRSLSKVTKRFTHRNLLVRILFEVIHYILMVSFRLSSKISYINSI